MIPVFEPEVTEDDIAAVTDALQAGEISGTFGASLERFEQSFAAYCGAAFGIATSSGTTALQLAVRAAGIEPGDAVLVSASTNIATALAVLHNGAVPIPVDSEATTWNMDIDLVEGLITSRTRAVLPVHLFGHPVDMDRLNEIAARHGLVVIEDAAEAHGAEVRGRRTGALGDAGCFSFYANKVITTGEGGMVTTDDETLAERLRLLRNLAFTTPRFKHNVAGFNFRLTSYQAAMGASQLSRIDDVISRKRRVASAYRDRLDDVSGLTFQGEAEWARSVYWMVGVVVGEESRATRDELAAALLSHGIETRTFFCPMNQQPCIVQQHPEAKTECPVADRLWDRGLYLPSSTSLTESDFDLIASRIREAVS